MGGGSWMLGGSKGVYSRKVTQLDNFLGGCARYWAGEVSHGWGELDVGRVRLWVFHIVELLGWATPWAGRAGYWAGEDAEDDER